MTLLESFFIQLNANLKTSLRRQPAPKILIERHSITHPRKKCISSTTFQYQRIGITKFTQVLQTSITNSQNGLTEITNFVTIFLFFLFFCLERSG